MSCVNPIPLRTCANPSPIHRELVVARRCGRDRGGDLGSRSRIFANRVENFRESVANLCASVANLAISASPLGHVTRIKRTVRNTGACAPPCPVRVRTSCRPVTHTHPWSHATCRRSARRKWASPRLSSRARRALSLGRDDVL
eukprot:226642-Prymnesium_polylepis.1